MRKFILGALLLLTATTAFSADPQPGRQPDFETVKAEVIKRINARIARNQEELACVQAAGSHDDLKACRQKFAADLKARRDQMREHRKDIQRQ